MLVQVVAIVASLLLGYGLMSFVWLSLAYRETARATFRKGCGGNDDDCELLYAFSVDGSKYEVGSGYHSRSSPGLIGTEVSINYLKGSPNWVRTGAAYRRVFVAIALGVFLGAWAYAAHAYGMRDDPASISLVSVGMIALVVVAMMASRAAGPPAVVTMGASMSFALALALARARHRQT